MEDSYVLRRDLSDSECASVECEGVYAKTGLYNEFGEVVHCRVCGDQVNRYQTKSEWLLHQMWVNSEETE